MNRAERRELVRESLAMRREVRRCVHPARLRRLARGLPGHVGMFPMVRIPGHVEMFPMQFSLGDGGNDGA
jgi:hypothetical protein